MYDYKQKQHSYQLRGVKLPVNINHLWSLSHWVIHSLGFLSYYVKQSEAIK